MRNNLHSALAGYVERNGLHGDSPRTDGAVVISLDNKYRIFARPALHGDLVFECRLLELPPSSAEADELIELCLMGSWVKMREFAEVPVLSQDQSKIYLQYRVPADATVEEFEGALEQFANSVAEWRRIFRVL